METIISYNKCQFWAKVAFSILYGAIFILIITRLSEKHVSQPKSTVIVMCIVLATLLMGIFLFLTSLYKLPVGVIIDTFTDTLLVSFLFNRAKLIRRADMQSYSSTYVNTKGSRYEGILLHLLTGEELLLSDFSLTDYKPIEEYLKKQRLIFSGQEKFRYIFYYFKNKSQHQLSNLVVP